MSFDLSPIAEKIFNTRKYFKEQESQTQTNTQFNFFNPQFMSNQVFMPGIDYTNLNLMAFMLNLQNVAGLFQMPPMPDIKPLDIKKLVEAMQKNPALAPKTNSPVDTFTPSEKNSKYNNHKYASMSVTEQYNGTAADLDEYLKGRGVLEGKGEKLIELQNKYGISASFLAAIAISESNGVGKFAKNYNNVTGITMPGGKGFRNFNSVEECLEYTAKLLKEQYVGRGLTTIAQIHSKYCPIGADNDPGNLNVNWGYNVGTKMTDMAV